MSRFVRFPLIIATVLAAVGTSGCGGSGRAPAATTAKALPPPNTAQIQVLNGLAEEASIVCSYAQIGGQEGSSDGALVHLVAQVESIARQTDIAGHEEQIENFIHKLEGTNSFNKPTCAPALGNRLSSATGIKPAE
jgi:hypothetical protein